MTESSLAAPPSYVKALEHIAIVEKKFKKLRRLAVDTRRLENEFATETTIYLDEWQMLLQHFLDLSEAEALLNNTHDPKWSSPGLRNDLRACLGSEYDSFIMTVFRIRDSITSLSDSFLVDLNTTLKVKGKGPATKNILDDFLNKSKYESSMDTFKEATQEFIRLRKTATEKSQHGQTHSDIKQPAPLPSSYQLATTYSKSLYEALRNFWTCLQNHHISHNACLLIDSRHDGSLRVVVHYRTQSDLQVHSSVDLLVCSRSIPLPPFAFPASDTPPSRQDTEEKRPAKVQKVRFAEDCTASRTGKKTTVAESSKDGAAKAAKDLCSGEDMCKQLCAHTKSEECGGYLDTPLNLRHTILPVCGISCDHTQCLNRQDLGEPVPLDKIFNFRVDNTLLVAEQLRLALRLVKGVLQFHSTPWLRPQWQLQDLRYFEPSNSLATSLETLHISSNLTFSGSYDSLDLPQDQMAKPLDKAIRNLTMYRLGVALLQIGQWVPLQPDDTAQVQRVIDLSTSCWPLGEQYHRITQKCLNCQFGFGNNLSEVDLQRAIYWDVVCGLEELVRKVDSR